MFDLKVGQTLTSFLWRRRRRSQCATYCCALEYLITVLKAKSKWVIPFTCWAFKLILKVLNRWINTQFNNIKLSFFSSHTKSSFPLYTVIWCSRKCVYVLCSIYISEHKCSRDSSTDPKRIHMESCSFPFPLYFSFQKWGFSLGNSSHLCSARLASLALAPLATPTLFRCCYLTAFWSFRLLFLWRLIKDGEMKMGK